MTAALPFASIETRDRGRPSLPSRTPTVNASPDRSRRGRTGRLVLFGVLWGIVITGMELPSMPLDATTERPVTTLFLIQSLEWAIGGLMLSLALWLSTRDDVRWLRLAALLPVVAALNGLAFVATSVSLRLVFGYGIADPMSLPMPPAPVVGYVSWLTLIYGSVAALIYALRRRIDQTTAALRNLSLARERNEAAVADARVSAMVERIEPRFLLEVMDTARRQYLVEAERAEATLNACTEFLRCAMPPLRSGHSTIAAELDLAGAYLALRDCMAGREPMARIDRPNGCGRHRADVDLHDVPLPPMTLLPILEQLLPKTSEDNGAGLAIDVSTNDGSVSIRIEAARHDRPRGNDPFDADSLATLSVRLARVCGHAASIRFDARSTATHPILYIVVPRHHDPSVILFEEQHE